MPVIDIIVIAILVIFAIVGMIKGFLNTILSLFGSLASFGASIFLAKPVATFLNNIFHIVPKIGEKIAGSLEGIAPFQDSAITKLTGAELKQYLENDGLTFQERIFKLFIEDSKTFTLESDAAAADATVTQYIGERVASVIAVVIAVVVLFLAIRLAIFLLSKLFNALTKNKAIGGINRLLGLVAGVIKASLLIGLVLGILYIIANSTVNEWIENSTVTKWLYEYVSQFVDYIVTQFNLPEFISSLFPAISA